ncbi:MAG TPA: SDR family NAD(P)-dependent oxidoreductase, partial [Candidatus Limnocylindria bacterium]
MSASPFELEGKRALVTGGSRGIGRAIAFALADAGADVAVTSRKGDDAEPVAAAIRAKGRRSIALLLEVRVASSIRVAFERLDREWKGLDILVNNAGTNVPQDLVHTDEASWDAVVDADLKGVVFVAQAAATRMIEAKRGGRIVNVASLYGVVGVTRALALDLAPHGITVNAVAPSLIETDPTRERMRSDPSYRDEELA